MEGGWHDVPTLCGVVIGSAPHSIKGVGDDRGSPPRSIFRAIEAFGSEGVSDEVLGISVLPASDADSERASCTSAVRRTSGNSRPRFSARRKIPAAALGLKKNLSGTASNSTSAKDEHTSPPLGHSEVSAVQHSPGEVVKPELGQRRE